MYAIQRKPFTLTILNGQTAIVSASVLNLNGLLRGIIVNVPILSSSHTLTIEIKDEDGQVIFTKTGIVNNAKTSFFIDANNYPLLVPLSGNEKITLTSSGTEGADRAITATVLVDRGGNR